MRIIVTDRESVERGLAMQEPYILISIRDPEKMPVRLRHCLLCKGVLELAFHDAESVEGFVPLDTITYMTEMDAGAIWDFVHKHEGDYGIIVVHCEQGMSRSPAVAAALAKGLRLDASASWQEHQPNQYVYETVLAARDKVAKDHDQ